MSEAEYEKIDIATEYLNLAASLWLSNNSLFSSAHLAGASEEITGKYCKLKGLQSKRDWWINFGNRFSDFRITGEEVSKEFYLPKNSIKHMNLTEKDRTVTLDIREVSSDLIRSAFSNFETLHLDFMLNEQVTEVIHKTTLWVETESR